MLDSPYITEVHFVDPIINKQWILKDKNLLVRGTAGAGDFMFTMCTAFFVANLLKTKINVIFYWKHDKDYYYHFEDEETIIERLDYFYSLCYKNELITYEHVFNFDVDELFRGEMLINLATPKQTHIGEQGNLVMPKRINSWKFKPHLFSPEVKKKHAVAWTYKFNAEKPSRWKQSYTGEHWDTVLSELRNQGWTVTELCYRTPIREALYHIQRAEFVLGYDGMWHYLARMLYKPTIIAGDNTIINEHNPQAMPFFSPSKDAKRAQDLITFVGDIDNNLSRLRRNVAKYKQKVDKFIEN